MRMFKLFDEVYIKSKHKRGQIVDLVTDNNGRDGISLRMITAMKMVIFRLKAITKRT